MPGGEIQLATRGAQDLTLVGNPQITFFKSVYRRYTNFSMETIELETNDIEISDTENSRIQCEIARNGDLVSQIYFNFKTPNIFSGADDNEVPYEFRWVENLGTNVINEARLLIGTTEIDKHDSNFFNIYSELRNNKTQKEIYNKMIGNVQEMYDPRMMGDKYFPIPVINPNQAQVSATLDKFSYPVYRKHINTHTTFLSAITNSIAQTIGIVLDMTNEDSANVNLYEGLYIQIGQEITGFLPNNAGGDIRTVFLPNAFTSLTEVSRRVLRIGDERKEVDSAVLPTNLNFIHPFSSAPQGASYGGAPFVLEPFTRRINSFDATTGRLLFDPIDTTIGPISTNLPYYIYRSKGFGMTVTAEMDTDTQKLKNITILEEGRDYVNNEELFIDTNNAGKIFNPASPNPTFYLTFSKYPHTKVIDSNSNRQYSDIERLAYTSVMKNSTFDSEMSSLIPSIVARDIRVPMNFFFNHRPGSALPLIALQYNEVFLELDLRRIRDLFTINKLYTETLSAGQSYKNFVRAKRTDIPITTFTTESEFKLNYNIEATYIFLDTQERRRFAESNHEYLITQVQKRPISGQTIGQRHELTLYHPVKELIFIAQRSDMTTINKWNNYTNWVEPNMSPDSYEYLNLNRDYLDDNTNKLLFYNKSFNTAVTDDDRDFDKKYFRKNIIDSIELIFNGSHIREREKNHLFYSNQQYYEYYKTNPKDGINVYTFSLNPNDFQPSGACNFSRIDNFQALIDFGIETNKFEIPADGVSPRYTYDLTVYAINYNILRISSGMGALQYAN